MPSVTNNDYQSCRLFAPFASLLESAVRRAGLTRTPGRLAGLTPPALALHAAAIARGRPVLLVVPTDADVETATADARFFLAGLEGLAEFEAQRRVLPLPSPEVDPYRGLAPHLEVSSARARALFGLADRSARVVVASARALLSRVSAPDLLQSTGFVIAPGREIAPHDLGDALARAGFTREDPVDEHGEFCLRGGVLDLFPASESEPVRLEFIGDIVESVRRYDAATQRSRAALDQVAIFPQREVVDDTADATIVDYAQRGVRAAPHLRGGRRRGEGTRDRGAMAEERRRSVGARTRRQAVRRNRHALGGPRTLAAVGPPGERAGD